MKSLRARLLRTLTIAMLLLFAAEWLLLGEAIRRTSEHGMLEHLAHDAQAVADALQPGPGAAPGVDAQRVEAVYREPQSGHYFVVSSPGAAPLASPSLGGFAMELRPFREDPAWHYRTSGPAGQTLIVHASRSRAGAMPVDIFVAEDDSNTDREIWRLSLASLAVFVPMLGVALLVQGIAVGRALRPLGDVVDQLREVGAGRHAQITGEVPLEVKPLVDELNRLLVQLHRRLKQTRAALGNLAHALKTPLAVLVRTVDDTSLPDAHRQMVRMQAATIRQRLELELRRARLAGPVAGGVGACFTPAAELGTLARALQAIHADKAIDLRIQAPDKLLPFDREDMLELVGNLADNACKWSKAVVTVSVQLPSGDGRPMQIAVADDGPGLARDEAADALRRGVRLDEATPGHGLGLAIVHDIVELYGGTLTLNRDPALGGLRVDVVLYPASHASDPG